jgi:DNA-binding transcriptional regulator YiaG
MLLILGAVKYLKIEGEKMTIKELRIQSGMNIKQFSEYFGIPYRTIQNWESGQRNCPEYLLSLIEYKLKKENII